MTCKICGRKYHVCSDCVNNSDVDEYEYRNAGFCSEKCFFSSDKYKEIERLVLVVRNALSPDDLAKLADLMYDFPTHVRQNLESFTKEKP
jgi:hypothetical protein